MEYRSMLLDELVMVPKEESMMSPNIQGNMNPFSNELLLNPWYLNNPFEQTQDLHYLPNTTPSLFDLISPDIYYNNYPCHFTELQPFLDDLTSPEFSSFNEPLISSQDVDFASNFEFFENGINGFEDGMRSSFNVENAQFGTPNIGIVGNAGACEEGMSKGKKPEGKPSKNLMAERRRRKRLNDRLSMLRSIVPKISKMDRTAILGDTIDYTKELLDKIHKLKEECKNENMNQINFIGNYLKELKPNEIQARNSPKFDVERRNEDTRVEVYCTPKPGLILSTLGTLDALGLDIQHCVISCFNDFSLQASCYEIDEHHQTSEEMKQALLRNAGYGGRCL